MSKSELLEWHATRNEHPEDALLVLGQWTNEGSLEREFYMAFVYGRQWFDEGARRCEAPDYWAEPKGIA